MRTRIRTSMTSRRIRGDGMCSNLRYCAKKRPPTKGTTQTPDSQLHRRLQLDRPPLAAWCRASMHQCRGHSSRTPRYSTHTPGDNHMIVKKKSLQQENRMKVRVQNVVHGTCEHGHRSIKHAGFAPASNDVAVLGGADCAKIAGRAAPVA